LSVKAVVFDYGRVISLPQDEAVVGRLAEMAGAERETFASALWGLRGGYDRGVVDAREYYREVFAELYPKVSVEARIDSDLIDRMIEMDLASWREVSVDTAALMEDVKRAGYTLGILSNMPRDFLAWARENLSVFSLPHVGVFSCEVNLLKPEEAIYRRLLDALAARGVASSSEVVFFDDMIENVSGAEALGIKAFLWKDAESARRELISLGVAL